MYFLRNHGILVTIRTMDTSHEFQLFNDFWKDKNKNEHQNQKLEVDLEMKDKLFLLGARNRGFDEIVWGEIEA